MSSANGSIAAELQRYDEMLAPLLELSVSGASELPADERRGLEAGAATVRSYHGDHLELEEAVAAFARALWAAPGSGEPRSWIAIALLVRARHWPERERAVLLGLARGFAEKAFAADPGSVAARIAWARAQLSDGQIAEAERIAGFLPDHDAMATALKSEVAETRGDLETAIRLREQQLTLETDPAVFRVARNKLGLLLHAAGRLDESIAIHQGNLARHPDYAWGHVNLASALEARGDLLDAFAEVESAVALGLADAEPYLDELAARLDRASLERFRTLLRQSRDGEWVPFTPAQAAAR